MNVAIIFSPNWSRYIEIELFALFKTNPAPIKAYLITDADGFFDTSHITSHFGDGYTVEFIDADELYRKRIPSTKNVDSRFTKYAIYRLIIPELIHDDRLIYIDADAIVNGDITELYNMELGDNYIAGALDIGAEQYNLKAPIGLGKNDIYINAGIMLMDLKKIREAKLQEKWVYEANRKHYLCHDQCIINLTCKGKIKEISNIYNVSISTGLDIPKDKVKIFHWAGIKPWNDATVPNARIWFDWIRNYKKVFNNG